MGEVSAPPATERAATRRNLVPAARKVRTCRTGTTRRLAGSRARRAAGAPPTSAPSAGVGRPAVEATPAGSAGPAPAPLPRGTADTRAPQPPSPLVPAKRMPPGRGPAQPVGLGPAADRSGSEVRLAQAAQNGDSRPGQLAASAIPYRSGRERRRGSSGSAATYTAVGAQPTEPAAHAAAGGRPAPAARCAPSPVAFAGADAGPGSLISSSPAYLPSVPAPRKRRRQGASAGQCVLELGNRTGTPVPAARARVRRRRWHLAAAGLPARASLAPTVLDSRPAGAVRCTRMSWTSVSSLQKSLAGTAPLNPQWPAGAIFSPAGSKQALSASRGRKPEPDQCGLSSCRRQAPVVPVAVAAKSAAAQGWLVNRSVVPEHLISTFIRRTMNSGLLPDRPVSLIMFAAKHRRCPPPSSAPAFRHLRGVVRYSSAAKFTSRSVAPSAGKFARAFGPCREMPSAASIRLSGPETGRCADQWPGGLRRPSKTCGGASTSEKPPRQASTLEAASPG